jgi:anti-sigma factor RsiW
MTEKISRFLDNDLTNDETSNLLKELADDPELKAKLKRYSAISQAMKTNSFSSVPDNFSARIQQEIRQTATVIELPRSRTRYYSFALIAASIGAIAVLAGSGIHLSIKQDYPLEIQKTPHQLSNYKQPETTRIIYQKVPSRFNARINDYLQEHNNNGYSNGESFVRLATYSK